MTDNKSILWFGSVFDDSEVLRNPAISPAANKWQMKFIESLGMQGGKVLNIGHCPERVFPYGRLFVNKRYSNVPQGFKLVSSSYINLPLLRKIILNIVTTVKLLFFFLKEKQKPSLIISYNIYSYNVLPILFGKYILRIRWVSILADPMNSFPKKANPLNRLADANVFLSYKLFSLSRTSAKMHLDGGIAAVHPVDSNLPGKKEKIILYTGTIAKYTGIELLVEAFNLLNNPDVRLVICGKGQNDLLSSSLKKNEKIHFLGTVDEKELERLYSEAFLFINPRLTSERINDFNFPSKILDYLSYCKPVISTFTSGMSDSYKEVIHFISNDDPHELAGKIDEVINWDKEKYLKETEKIREFVINKKLWTSVISEFNTWLNKDVLK